MSMDAEELAWSTYWDLVDNGGPILEGEELVNWIAEAMEYYRKDKEE